MARDQTTLTELAKLGFAELGATSTLPGQTWTPRRWYRTSPLPPTRIRRCGCCSALRETARRSCRGC